MEGPQSDAKSPTVDRTPGRPRCEHTCEALRQAALDIIEKKGFLGLTVEAIAAQAGASKATVYRWWSGKSELLVDAFFTKISPDLKFPETGSLRTDCVAQMRMLVEQMNGPNGKVLASLLAGAQMDEGMADAVRTRWLALRRVEGRKVIDRAIARGELEATIDTDFLFDLLYSPLYFRLLLRHRPLTDDLVEKIVDAVLRGISKASGERE